MSNDILPFEQIMQRSLPIIMSKGQEREQAIKEFNELVKVFEEGIKTDFPGEFSFFDGKSLGFLDIIVGIHFCHYEAFHEAVAVNITPEKSPAFLSWANALKDHPLLKATLPPHEKLVAKMRKRLSGQSPEV